MIKQVKNDIDKVLSSVIELIKKQDYSRILSWSDRVIHNASIYQDDDSVTVAVLVYALGNLLQRCSERGKTIPEVIPTLELALKDLRSNNMNAFHAKLKDMINIISKQDESMKLYIQEVITKAKIRKASGMHKHSISIARTAELLGISQWELHEYVGAMRDGDYEGTPVLKRLQRARSARSIVLDAGPVIAITANNLLWAFRDLKKSIDGRLIMPVSVSHELVTRGLETRRFKFEALQVGGLIKDGTFEVTSTKKIEQLTSRLLRIANGIFFAGKQNIRLVQRGEMEALATSIIFKSDAVAVDERVTRTLIESPSKLKKVMELRLHRKLSTNKINLKKFHDVVKEFLSSAVLSLSR